jgi:hypothetical protein
MIVRVKDLKAGDVLKSGATVTESPYQTARLDSKKVLIGIQYKGQTESYTREWGKETTVNIHDRL